MKRPRLYTEDYWTILVVVLAITSILYFSGAMDDPIRPAARHLNYEPR